MNYIIITLLILWGIRWAIRSIESSKLKAEEEKLRSNKYGKRAIDTSLTLYKRNLDIIHKHAQRITTGCYRSYYIEDATKVCLRDICLAEGRTDIRPRYSYLYQWENSAPSEWKELSGEIKKHFSKRKSKLEKLESDISKIKQELKTLRKKRLNPLVFQKIQKTETIGSINIDAIRQTLLVNLRPWIKREEYFIKYGELFSVIATVKEFPKYQSEICNEELNNLNKDIDEYNKESKQFVLMWERNKTFYQSLIKGYEKGEKESVIKRIDCIVNDINLPNSFPKTWETDFEPEEGIAMVEISLPDIVHTRIFKKVTLKTKTVEKPLTQKEIKEMVPDIQPAIALRLVYEIFRSDHLNKIKLLVLNGWVEFDDPRTGVKKRAYTLSLSVKKEQIEGMNLEKISPLAALDNLNGTSAGRLIDIIPIVPILSLNRKDSRFIDTKEVIENMDSGTNLASMDWQDFENLIAELFEKEFASKEGGEVKVTQSSRDRGVDAIAFDPDPIRGGKFVIQAKRYTNTVGVSAVRDLCAVVRKEGASRGILVTTSSYGADAYAFAQNEPITLLNGAELLGLMEKHGYKFRIDLQEAKRMNLVNAR